MTFPWALAVPGIIFLVIIVPLWITFHYVTVWMRMRAGSTGRGAAGSEEIERMQALAERLEQRIESLETILDTDVPDWRKR